MSRTSSGLLILLLVLPLLVVLPAGGAWAGDGGFRDVGPVVFRDPPLAPRSPPPPLGSPRWKDRPSSPLAVHDWVLWYQAGRGSIEQIKRRIHTHVGSKPLFPLRPEGWPEGELSFSSLPMRA